MHTDCNIRLLTDLDEADFLSVYQRVFPEKNITAQYIANIKNEPASIFVAAPHFGGRGEGGGVLGFLYFWTLSDEIQIIDMGVLPGFRRQGIAQKLLQHLILQAATKKIFLEVRVGNAAAIAVYESCGFQKVGERKKYYADGEDAWVFILPPR